ncbi:MAG: hypothetical protein QOI22_2117, partial [Verrucomicrobiota bacterium]
MKRIIEERKADCVHSYVLYFE